MSNDTTTSNTKECFDTFIGQTVKGVLFGGLHGHGSDTKTLIFEDGRGFTFNGNGAFWVTSTEDVARAVRKASADLAATESRLKEVLDLAGVSS